MPRVALEKEGSVRGGGGIEKSVVLLQPYACCVFIFQRQTPRSSNLVMIAFENVKEKKKKNPCLSPPMIPAIFWTI